jgi:nucleoside 2-deoxyribosyltransferase
MPDERPPRLRCFLALSSAQAFRPLREAIRKGVEEADFRPVSLDEQPLRAAASIREALLGEVARADCIVADLTDLNPNIFFELGLAQGMGKRLFLLIQGDDTEKVPVDLRWFQLLMGRSVPPEMLLEIANHEPDFLLHRLLREDEHLERLVFRGESTMKSMMITTRPKKLSRAQPIALSPSDGDVIRHGSQSRLRTAGRRASH